MTTARRNNTQTPSQALRSTWLEALLPLVADMGWTRSAAAQAADIAGLDAGERALAAPGGVRDLLEAFFDAAEQETRAAIDAADLEGLKVHERVAFGVRAWLDALSPHRIAVAKASARAFWPTSTGDAAQRCWSVADMIWAATGDTSEDYNKYTKRGLLASTLPPITLYWQSNPESDALDAFIARRLNAAMTLGRTGGRVLGPLLNRFTAT